MKDTLRQGLLYRKFGPAVLVEAQPIREQKLLAQQQKGTLRELATSCFDPSDSLSALGRPDALMATGHLTS